MARRVLVGVALLLMGAGCATQQHDIYAKRSFLYDRSRAEVNASEDDVDCGMEMTTGSHIAHRVCRDKGAVEQTRLYTQDIWRTLHMINRVPLDDFDLPAVRIQNP